MSRPPMKIPGDPVLFHTGSIVDDIEQAMAEMTAALGTQWCEPSKGGMSEVWTPDGMVEFENRLVFSLDPVHRVELIQQVDVRALPPAPGGQRLHHLGYWVTDADAARSHLDGMGYTTHFARLSADRSRTLVSYHANPTGGLFIELLDRSIQPGIEAWISGGSLRLENEAGD